MSDRDVKPENMTREAARDAALREEGRVQGLREAARLLAAQSLPPASAHGTMISANEAARLVLALIPDASQGSAPCLHCKGSGRVLDTIDGATKQCRECNGRGAPAAPQGSPLPVPDVQVAVSPEAVGEVLAAQGSPLPGGGRVHEGMLIEVRGSFTAEGEETEYGEWGPATVTDQSRVAEPHKHFLVLTGRGLLLFRAYADEGKTWQLIPGVRRG